MDWKLFGFLHVIFDISLRCKSGAQFSKLPTTFWTQKAFRKNGTPYSLKLVFSYVVKGIKNENNCKVSCLKLRCLCFEDTGIKSFSFLGYCCIVWQKLSTKSLMAALSDCFPFSSCLLLRKYWDLVPNNDNTRVKETNIWLSFKTWCSLSILQCTASSKGNWNSWCLYTKRIMSPEMRPKSFRTFQKRAPDPYQLVWYLILLPEKFLPFDWLRAEVCTGPEKPRGGVVM